MTGVSSCRRHVGYRDKEGLDTTYRTSNRGCSAGDSYHRAVNAWLRIFLYGLHGFFDEIVFTSLFNFVESNFLDWKFRGHSSLWSFFQYGFGSFVVEQMYLTWKDKWYLPMPVRGVLYVIWVYL